ncbi:MAG TPA: cytochrome P450 [Burkholderiaceae bacterium]|nr:cytochrome P450 [Burkholderiaceae bacterium]
MIDETVHDTVHYDPRSKEVLESPFAAYAELREKCPIHRYDGMDPTFYSVTRYADVREVLNDVETWSSAKGTTLMHLGHPVGVLSDPPEHTEFRKLFQSRLLPKALAHHAKHVEEVVHRLLDRLQQSDEGDLYEDYASLLPLTVICQLLGLPGDLETVQHLRGVTDDLVASGFGGGNPKRSDWLERYTELARFFNVHIQQRRETARQAGIEKLSMEHVGTVLPDDLTSLFVCATYQGEYLRDSEIQFTLYGLLLGGSKATSGLISNLFMRLLEDPSRWEQVKANPELIDIAIEESLRMDAPTLGMWRTSTCPVTMHGVEIPEDAKLMVMYGSANHDASVFSDPESFRLDRSMDELRKHVAFGFGPHFCAGAHLARMEARMTLVEVIRRMPKLRMNGTPERLTTTFSFWGRKKLPVAWG